MALFDHISLTVSDYARSKAFYEKALAPLGAALIKELGESAGFSSDGETDFWIGEGPTSFQKPGDLAPITPVHVAFLAKDRAEVRAFHAAALAAGGRDFGAPGLRPEYHPKYYGAFVLDPDGHNVEAVCHHPE
jgi:catechol 2,3-dioxygenase-like lactoylglutathione lyase family enzyme